MTETLLVKLRKFRMLAYMPEALYLQGRAFAALGQSDIAGERLQEARAAAEAIGSRRTLWPILFSLSQLQSDQDEALRLRQQAREIIHYISRHIDTTDLRATFLNQPHVKEVLNSVE